MSGEVALDASSDFAERAALREASLEVSLGVGVAAHLDHRRGVQGMVQTSVTAAIEAMPDGVARGRGDRVDVGERGECGF